MEGGARQDVHICQPCSSSVDKVEPRLNRVGIHEYIALRGNSALGDSHKRNEKTRRGRAKIGKEMRAMRGSGKNSRAVPVMN